MKQKNEFTEGGIINCGIEEAEQILLGIGYDVTSSGMKGADKGPQAVLNALKYQIEPYNTYFGREMCKIVKTAYISFNLGKMSPEQMMEDVSDMCIRVMKWSKKLMILGGEHSVTIPAFKTYSGLNGTDDITILHIDAHLDLRDTDEFRVKPYGKYAHCCVMRRAWDFGFRHFVQVGARAYSQEEWEFARKNNFKVFCSRSEMPRLADIVATIKTEKVWVSLDVDGICPGDMPATGTPVGGGPGLDYIRELLKEVAYDNKIVGADVVEVAPDLGLTNLTAYNAAQLVYDLIGYMNP